jgi:hypothetical protein
VTGRPFTVAVCQAGPCAHDPDLGLIERLAAAIRCCPHGVLIRTGCLLRVPRCRIGPAHDSGAYVLVQPCTLDREPQGAAISVGPVLTRDDVEAVATWREDGDPDTELLDGRLRPTSRRPR